MKRPIVGNVEKPVPTAQVSPFIQNMPSTKIIDRPAILGMEYGLSLREHPPAKVNPFPQDLSIFYQNLNRSTISEMESGY